MRAVSLARCASIPEPSWSSIVAIPTTPGSLRSTPTASYFVTRMKDNADYGVVERRPLPERGPVQRDEIIFLYKLARGGERDLFLRRIEVWDEAQQRTLVFLTNHRGFAASTIAAVYRQRWQIELFFKALKQNLRIKTFVGTSSNALQIQVWTALIALLLLKYLQLRARFGWSLSNLAALLRQQLFVYRDLFSWIDQPFQPPPHSTPSPSKCHFPGKPNLDSRMPTSTWERPPRCRKCPNSPYSRSSIPANLDSSGAS